MCDWSKHLQPSVWIAQICRKTDVVYYPDNFLPLMIRSLLPDSLTQRTLIWPEAFGHRLIDDDHSRMISIVIICEGPSLKQAGADRIEVSWTYLFVKDFRQLSGFGFWLPFDDDRAAAVEAPDWL